MILALIAIVDYAKCLVAVPLKSQNLFLIFPWIASFIRPWELIIMITMLRNYWRRYFNVMRHTFQMVIVIVSFVFYYSYIGHRIFAGTIEGSESFSTTGDAFWNMFVLLTTANFPDIMLPAYNKSGFMCAYFIFFLTFGLWLLMNLFLAIFYSRYQYETDTSIDAD